MNTLTTPVAPLDADAGAAAPWRSLTLGLRVVVPALVACVFFEYLPGHFGIPSRLIIVALLVGVLLTGIGPHGPVVATPGVGYLAALIIAGGGYALSTLLGGDAVASSNGQRSLVTFPMAVAAGWVLLSSRAGMDYLARVIVAISVPTAVLALVEFLRGTSLLSRDAEFASYIRDNSARAVVGAEHPLILGVLLSVSVPFAYLALRRWWVRWAVVLLLLAGVYATGSRGPLGVSAGILALLAVPGLLRFLARHFGAVFFAVLVGLGVLWYFASRVWQPVTTSSDTLANSMQYRAAIYSLLPRILLAQPFGYGLGDLPAGTWLVRGPDQISDITATVDSQWVLAALRLGWVGVVLLFMIIVVAVLALRRRLDYGLALLLFTGCGAFVALDAWDGAGTLWMLLFGAGLRLLSYPPHSLETRTPTAPPEPRQRRP